MEKTKEMMYQIMVSNLFVPLPFYIYYFKFFKINYINTSLNAASLIFIIYKKL